jgi:PAS domain S-box-containing protein
MMERFSRWQKGLSIQIVITLAGLVFLTAFAIGLPALWVLHSQLERQAWALVNQGSQTSLAVLANKQSGLTNLAILTAQRPTLESLVVSSTPAELTAYLETLRSGAGLDLLVVCGPQGQIRAQVGKNGGDQVCAHPAGPEFISRDTTGVPQAWLLASSSLPQANGDQFVVVGLRLDESFFVPLARETGLEHILLHRGQYVTGSFAEGQRVWESRSSPGGGNGGRQAGQLLLAAAGRPYFASQVLYGSGEFELVISRPTADVVQARQQLTWVVAGGIAAVGLLSSALGIARSRKISRPLEKLKDAADGLRQGQLAVPIQVDTEIYELKLLSFALEDARVAINHTLKELNQEKAWSEHVLESVVEGIVTIDRRGQITFFSRGAEVITGWKQEQVLGQTLDETFPLYEADELFSQRLPQPGSKQKIGVRLPDGRPVTLAVSGSRLGPPEAGQADTALVLRDVSNEEAIRRLLGEFLANISHEFKTPLSALSASIELLLDQLADLETREVEDLLNNIHLGTLSLQQLIDNLLEGASLETGRFQVSCSAVKVEEILQEAGRVIQPLAVKYGLTLQKDGSGELPLVWADFRRTVQVMVNLLSNAVKWSPEGGEIRISVCAVDGGLEVCVGDQGPGIPAEILPDLFHRFGHTQGAGRSAQGVGLGLSVVKAIVEAQGGQVGVRSQGGGTEFWFTLEYAHQKLAALEAQP